MTIELDGSFNGSIYITFERYEAIRMLEERILLNDIYYTDSKFKEFGKKRFENVIYELEDGSYMKFLMDRNDHNKKYDRMNNYLIVTMNYFTEIITDVKPNFQIVKY